jgi:hypothetical protein
VCFVCRAQSWCNQDPCGVICATITWLLILYAQYTITVRRPSVFVYLIIHIFFMWYSGEHKVP